MIEKERLEELIGQKKSIYWKFAKIKPSSWSKYTIMGNTIVKGNLKEIYSLDDLFETKEDFEWYREFGCIERTERLELPTYEEFLELNRYDNCFSFLTKYNERYCILIGNDIYMHNDMLKPKDEWTIVIHNEDDEYIFEQPLTKENYTLACRQCVKLFKGE